MDSVTRSLAKKCFSCFAAMLFLVVCAKPFLAWQTSPISPPPNPDSMSDPEKKLYVQRRLLESYQTDDPAVKIEILRDILTVDPSNPFAREDLAKAESDLEKKVLEGRVAQTRSDAIQHATDAL